MAEDYRRVLITGGTGFLGYNLYQALRRLNAELDIWVYSRRTGGDVTNYQQTEAAMQDKDLVLNLAAQTHVDFSIDGTVEEKQQFIDTNVKGTLNVLMAGRKTKTKIIHISTSEVYGTSQTPGIPMTETHPLLAQAGVYAVSKASADLLCRMAFMTEGQEVIIVRPFNMYGPHQSMEKLFPRFINMAMYGEPLTIYGDGEQRRDYVWAQDVAEALWRLRYAEAGTIVNIGTEISHSINELADRIISVCNSKGMRVHTSMSATRPAEVRELNGSNKLLYDITGFRPKVGLAEGIQKCVDWYTSNSYIVPPKILNFG